MFNAYVSPPVRSTDTATGLLKYTGVVQWYKPEAGYGFLPGDVFFHAGQYMIPKVNTNGHLVLDRPQSVRVADVNGWKRVIKPCREPAVGDVILYDKFPHGGKVKASIWTFQDIFTSVRDDMLEQDRLRLAEYDALLVYRLTSVTVTYGKPVADNVLKKFVSPRYKKTQIIFFGNNIEMLKLIARKNPSIDENRLVCEKIVDGVFVGCEIP